MYLALTAALTLLGLWFTYWVVHADVEYIRFDVPEPIFLDIPDTTFDPRGFV